MGRAPRRALPVCLVEEGRQLSGSGGILSALGGWLSAKLGGLLGVDRIQQRVGRTEGSLDLVNARLASLQQAFDRLAAGAEPDIDIDRRIRELARLVNPRGNPNDNAIWRIAKDLDLIKLNIKFFGYEIARQLAAALPVRDGLAPSHVGLVSKASTQADLESDWVAYWAGELKVPVLYHRKLWELAYVLQVLWEQGCLAPGKRGLGFGCGVEPIPSLLAARGVDVTVTDLPPDHAAAQGWARSNEHAAALDQVWRPELVDRAEFDRHASFEYVDMTAIPAHLTGYDFCWSVCALEHLGSITDGLRFIEDALATLRPGGVAVHTTEYNYANDDATIDHWVTVLFQRRHFTELAERLAARGHQVAALDFRVGDAILDRFVDLPPFPIDMTPFQQACWGRGTSHIKVAVDGFAVTCFGIVVRKAEAP